MFLSKIWVIIRLPNWFSLTVSSVMKGFTLNVDLSYFLGPIKKSNLSVQIERLKKRRKCLKVSKILR